VHFSHVTGAMSDALHGNLPSALPATTSSLLNRACGADCQPHVLCNCGTCPLCVGSAIDVRMGLLRFQKWILSELSFALQLECCRAFIRIGGAAKFFIFGLVLISEGLVSTL
jgi:hypothetical protein